jgi:hypothetical protein
MPEAGDVRAGANTVQKSSPLTFLNGKCSSFGGLWLLKSLGMSSTPGPTRPWPVTHRSPRTACVFRKRPGASSALSRGNDQSGGVSYALQGYFLLLRWLSYYGEITALLGRHYKA